MRKEREMDPAHPGHKLLSFRSQRAVAAYIVELLLITFSVAVIWNHIDTQIPTDNGTYRVLAKMGLALVEVVCMILVSWELFARDKTFSMICFAGTTFVTVVMLAHAGAVLQMDSGLKRQADTLKTVADAKASIAAAKEKARIEAAGQQAAQLNALGQRQTARRLVAEAGRAQSGRDDNELLEATLAKTKPKTFLPDWYIEEGWLYFLPPLLAFLTFMAVMLASKAALPYEDLNRNGIPDHLEPWAFRHASGQPAPMAAQDQRRIGFPTAPNTNITYTSPEPERPKAQPPANN